MIKKNITLTAIRTLKIESEAIREQVKHIDRNFIDTVKLIYQTVENGGKIIVTGIGKSGIVARKISATFSSVGIPSVFVNITELIHGDLGMITSGDTVFILSYSGVSQELIPVVPAIKSIGSKIIVMTGQTKSFLGKISDCVINVSVKKEACPYNLVPTASTTAMLAVGDALALSTATLKGFRKSDFARHHPGGNLGKRLTLRVDKIMRKGADNPIIDENATVKDALKIMTEKKLGAVSVVNKRKQLVGYFTDGDLRRNLQKDTDILRKKLKSVMTKNPKTITPEALADDAARLMKKYNCDNLPVINKDGKPIGIIDERDLISSGIM